MGCCGSTATVPPDSSPLPAQAVYQRETVQPTQQTLVPSSTGTPQASSEASSSKSSNGKPAPNSAQPDDKTNSTLPPTPHAATLAPKLARGRSQGLESSLYHGGGGDSRHWGRSTSMDPRNPPAGTQPVLWAAPARRHGGQPRFSTTLKSLLHNDFRYAVRRCPIDHYLQLRPQIQNSRCGKGACYLIRQTLGPTDARFIVARIWQVLTHQCHFQSKHVGMYPIIFAFLPHQLMCLAKL
jgi:hypothetical protein